MAGEEQWLAIAARSAHGGDVRPGGVLTVVCMRRSAENRRVVCRFVRGRVSPRGEGVRAPRDVCRLERKAASRTWRNSVVHRQKRSGMLSPEPKKRHVVAGAKEDGVCITGVREDDVCVAKRRGVCAPEDVCLPSNEATFGARRDGIVQRRQGSNVLVSAERRCWV
ncbi:hypothetical protein GUJ93_ZPchr0013g37661 [Zizania palustris]|uniref:Uncharacterized protein n=1 Tax=Zizania palustris TaxID=103762 RepID=A0A8J5WTX4_ZIZPA|nr:hypothetical protein GUJ93_ZPchr0013g37661 [Zizania palustris]